MRFSLKWILAGMVYVAIAAAAFGRGQWYYADAVWALLTLAFSKRSVRSLRLCVFLSTTNVRGMVFLLGRNRGAGV